MKYQRWRNSDKKSSTSLCIRPLVSNCEAVGRNLSFERIICCEFVPSLLYRTPHQSIYHPLIESCALLQSSPSSAGQMQLPIYRYRSIYSSSSNSFQKEKCGRVEHTFSSEDSRLTGQSPSARCAAYEMPATTHAHKTSQRQKVDSSSCTRLTSFFR